MPLILPPSVSRSREAGTKVLRCMVPDCGKEFPMDHGPQFARHVKACANKNHDQIEEIIDRSRDSVFTRPADEEMYAHFRRGGT